jgi:hypothetical protein
MDALAKLLPMPKKSDYISATERARGRGAMLASNVLHDDYLTSSDPKRSLAKAYPAWAREILAYEGSSEFFQKGRDIVDHETGWVLPACYVPQEIFSRSSVRAKGLDDRGPSTIRAVTSKDFPVGLFIDPEEVEAKGGRSIIHPLSMAIIWGFPCLGDIGEKWMDGLFGAADAFTRVPSWRGPENLQGNRRLIRLNGLAIRPIGRSYDDELDSMTIFGNCHPSEKLGVLLERPLI